MKDWNFRFRQFSGRSVNLVGDWQTATFAESDPLLPRASQTNFIREPHQHRDSAADWQTDHKQRW